MFIRIYTTLVFPIESWISPLSFFLSDIMLKNKGTIIILVFLVLTFMFWLTSMVTPGWLRHYTRKNYGGPSILKEVELSIFYIKVCNNSHCELLSTEEFSEDLGSNTLYLLEQKIQSVAALLLCATSSILVFFQLISTSTKPLFFVIIILPVSATLEGDLILEMMLANIRVSNLPFSENTELYFPYSILMSGLGTLFAIVGWVMAFVMYYTTRNQGSQNPYLRMEETRDWPITEQSSWQGYWQYI